MTVHEPWQGRARAALDVCAEILAAGTRKGSADNIANPLTRSHVARTLYPRTIRVWRRCELNGYPNLLLVWRVGSRQAVVRCLDERRDLQRLRLSRARQAQLP